jgi:hypothetical protein
LKRRLHSNQDGISDKKAFGVGEKGLNCVGNEMKTELSAKMLIPAVLLRSCVRAEVRSMIPPPKGIRHLFEALTAIGGRIVLNILMINLQVAVKLPKFFLT